MYLNLQHLPFQHYLFNFNHLNFYPNSKSSHRIQKLSIYPTEEVININPPPYGYNKKKKHCMLYIWKHETGIKINFDLWKP